MTDERKYRSGSITERGREGARQNGAREKEREREKEKEGRICGVTTAKEELRSRG